MPLQIHAMMKQVGKMLIKDLFNEIVTKNRMGKGAKSGTRGTEGPSGYMAKIP